MNIPVGINHRVFWELAKKKNIKISSKFTGVYLNINNNGSPSWMCRIQSKGKLLYFKRFPFTEQGEIDAANRYLNYKTLKVCSL